MYSVNSGSAGEYGSEQIGLGVARNMKKDASILRKGVLAKEVQAKLLLILSAERYPANRLIPHFPAMSRSTPEDTCGKVEVLLNGTPEQ
jgi:hypothetical protein